MRRPVVAAVSVLALTTGSAACGGGGEAVSERASGTASAPPATTEPEGPTVLDVLEGDARFGTFVELVRGGPEVFGAKMDEAGWNHTVLAPTDEAFAELPAGAVELLEEDEIVLHAVLDNVLTSEIVTADDLRARDAFHSFEDFLPVGEDHDGRITVGDATVVEADIEAANGLVHALDRVPIPRLYRDRLLEPKP